MLEVPDGWHRVSLGEVLSIHHGKRQNEVEDPNGRYPILASGGQIGLARKFLYDKPSVLIGRKGTIDRPRYMDSPFWTVDTLFYSSIKEPNVPKFLYYLFCQINWRRYNEASGVPSLNANTIEGIEVNLPREQDEQHRISAILTIVDEFIQDIETGINKLIQFKQGLLHDLLTRGIDDKGELRDPERHPEQFKDSPLGRIPRGWEVRSLWDITDLQVGFAFKSLWFRESGSVRLLRGDNVGYGTPDWNTPKFLASPRVTEFTEYLLEAGDIVIGMDRTFTKSGVKVSVLADSDLPALLVQRVGRFRPTQCTRPFLRSLLSWPRFLVRLEGQQKGMDIPHLSKSEILTPIVPVPPLGEQVAIADVLEATSSKIASEITSVQKLRTFKQGLMDDLLTGRVRVPESMEVSA